MTDPITKKAFGIVETGQLTYQALRIAAGNFIALDVERGEPACPSAGLWFYVRDDTSQNHFRRVFIGDAFTVADHDIAVLGIEQMPDERWIIGLEIGPASN